MEAAILIMAHHQPAHLAKLVKFLTCDWIHIFIHIDKKFEITPFLKSVPQNQNVTFLDKRIEVNWGGFSQVKAILNLLHVSLHCEQHFDRFCLLSGSDFPIKPLPELKAAFNSEKEFMRIDRRLHLSENHQQVDFVKYYHFVDSPFAKTTATHPKISRKIYEKIELYHGSQWWCLTLECVKYMSEFMQNNSDYLEFHRHTFAADEIFFHSLVKSSPFAKNITHDFEKAQDIKEHFASSDRGSHYIYWNLQKLPRKPKVFSSEDLNQILSSQALFARKFQEGISDNLLLELQKYLDDQQKTDEI